MLIRTGGGHAARLSIPRDTVVEIPGHGLQKINAAHAFGGPAESVAVIKRWLGIPINHVVEVNFENFPQLIDAMGGVDYTGGCIISRIDGGFSQGGYTLRLPAGTHHIDGKQALALARTRENLCAPERERPPARGTPAGAVQRDEEPPALALELLPPALDRLERAAGDHLRHERPDAARAVRRRWPIARHAADARAQAARAPSRCPERRAGLTRLRSRTPRGGRAVHERLSAPAPRRRARRPARALGGDGFASFGLRGALLALALGGRAELRGGARGRLALAEDFSRRSPSRGGLLDEDFSAAAAVSRWRLRVP